MWPCCYCFSFGYLFSVCTLGMSFCAPHLCISEAKHTLDKSLLRANEYILNKKGLHISYHSKCSTSWLQIDISRNNNGGGINLSSSDNLTEECLVKNQF
jgi:hypothetical protein